MNKENRRMFIKALIKKFNNNTELKKFQYYDEFLTLWKEKLFYYSNPSNDTLYWQKEFNDKNQIFCYTICFNETIFTLDFNIYYLIELLKHDEEKRTNLFSKIILTNSNGLLTFSDFNCQYTRVPITEIKESSDYTDIDKILIIPMPIEPFRFLCIDGNHRICSQINENKASIAAYYVDDLFAAKSLGSIFETCIYCFLYDVGKILNNIEKVNHYTIKKDLYLFTNSQFKFDF